MTICWLSTQVLAVATWDKVHIHDIIVDKSSVWFTSQNLIWGMVHSESELLVGTSQDLIAPEELSLLSCIRYTHTLQPQCGMESWVHNGELKNPTLVGKEIACISPTTGVWLFDPSFTGPPHSTKNPPLLGEARSLAVLLGRNVIIQTDDSIQIFSSDVLTSGEAHKKPIHLSHAYPLGKKHIICVQSNRHLIVLELETLKEFHPNSPSLSPLTNISPFGQASDQSPFACASLSHGVLAKFDISLVMELWKSGPEVPKHDIDDILLTGLSPMCTLYLLLLNSHGIGLWVKHAKDGLMLARLPIEDDDPVGRARGYDLIFESETRFYLRLDEPGQWTLIPFDNHITIMGLFTHNNQRGTSARTSGNTAICTRHKLWMVY